MKKYLQILLTIYTAIGIAGATSPPAASAEPGDLTPQELANTPKLPAWIDPNALDQHKCFSPHQAFVNQPRVVRQYDETTMTLPNGQHTLVQIYQYDPTNTKLDEVITISSADKRFSVIGERWLEGKYEYSGEGPTVLVTERGYPMFEDALTRFLGSSTTGCLIQLGVIPNQIRLLPNQIGQFPTRVTPKHDPHKTSAALITRAVRNNTATPQDIWTLIANVCSNAASITRWSPSQCLRYIISHLDIQGMPQAERERFWAAVRHGRDQVQAVMPHAVEIPPPPPPPPPPRPKTEYEVENELKTNPDIGLLRDDITQIASDDGMDGEQQWDAIKERVTSTATELRVKNEIAFNAATYGHPDQATRQKLIQLRTGAIIRQKDFPSALGT
ncbi:MAG: hypothetical protein LBJ69_01230 [Holosporales bacterium]|jgi:hypothetical protein|nr:hypothetical protein [Holosporales bacterium]